MRALLAAIFLLIGLGVAMPEPEFRSFVGNYLQTDAGGGPPARVDIESASHRTELLDAAMVPAAVSAGEMPHTDAIELPIAADTGTDQPVSVSDLCNAMFTSAQDNGLPVQFFANLIWQESRLQDDAVSPVGALGIAQFMPEVAAETGLENPLDPLQAIPASARLLRDLKEQLGNLGFAAAAYNAGAHRVSDWLSRGKALPRETLNYVLRVTGISADQWRTTPPADTTLTFAQHLPCRSMPAFADLEQTQLEQAQAEQPTGTPPKPVEDEKPIAATPAPKTSSESEVRSGGSKPSLAKASPPKASAAKASPAKALAKALNIQRADDTGTRHHAKHERQAQHERPKNEHNKKLAEG